MKTSPKKNTSPTSCRYEEPHMKTSPVKKPCRRAAIVQEAVMAIVITTAVLLSVSELLGRLAHQRRFVEQRTASRHRAANLMEDALSRPWSRLTTEDLQRRSATSDDSAHPFPNSI